MQTEVKFNESKKLFINLSFNLLWFGRLVSQLGDKLYLLALPWLVLDLSHSALYSSITLALEIIPEILLGPFIGVYVDQWSRKTLMVFSDWIRGFLVGGITLLAYFQQIEIYHIYIASFMLSAFTLTFDSSSQGYLSKIVAKEQLVEANANLTFVATAMRLIGPILSGIFIGWIGAVGTIGLNGISFLSLQWFLVFYLKTIHKKPIRSIKKCLWGCKKDFSIYLGILFFSQLLSLVHL
ncbi:MFS transporter [Tepidibacillus marianensis]|uniref:MFS transporter n=1 Tax=Tepidibacillus marianensis TaxID=3131995 RepID=UPI0030CE57A7